LRLLVLKGSKTGSRNPDEFREGLRASQTGHKEVPGAGDHHGARLGGTKLLNPVTRANFRSKPRYLAPSQNTNVHIQSSFNGDRSGSTTEEQGRKYSITDTHGRTPDDVSPGMPLLGPGAIFTYRLTKHKACRVNISPATKH
jgi:hypothetical protein